MTERTVDLTNCDREPIHIPGAIQAHGCLIACDASLEIVRRSSQNAAELLQLDDPSLVGRAFTEVMGGSLAHDIRNALAKSRQASRPGLLFRRQLREGGPLFDIAVHQHKGASIAEFEHVDTEAPGEAPLDIARTLMASVSRAKTVDEMIAATPRLMRAVLGYDRVMIYRFTHDEAGKVIGEAKRNDLEGFLGQYFPGSDIPQQARALYLQNTIRIISDASGVRVPVTPELNASGEPLDLSFAHLRSVSPVHCEYLRNMGVAASMSVSIIVDGALWGLIACHHYAPRTLSMAQRTATEMFGEFFSLQLEALTKKAKLETAQRARRALDRVMREISYHGDIETVLRDTLPDFAAFLPSDGIALWMGGGWTSHGLAPPKDAREPLMRFLVGVSDAKVWATHELSERVPEAGAYSADVAGVLAIPLSQIPRDFLLFFRKEVIHTVEWGGDPNKTYEVGPLGDRLTPRKSFAIWKETVERQSQPWTEDDREMAEAARTALLEVIMRHNEILEAERQTADLRQKLLNEELNHRVKNILSLIKSLVSQPVEQGRSLADYAGSLRGRIMALSHAHDQVVRSDGGGSLQTLLEAELSPYRENAAITMTGAPVSLDSRAYSVMALVAHELATNAAKYGALSAREGKLTIAWTRTAEGSCEIAWTEEGGPPVNPPKRLGFGSVLLNRSIPFDLGGESTITYAKDGVRARLLIPAKFVLRSPDYGAREARPAAAVQRQRLDGLNVLLVEDQLVIALDAEAMLTASGAAAVESVATVSEAMRVLEKTKPDVAILDVNLGNGTSIPVAEALVSRNIPFIFATGYGDSIMIPSSLSFAPVARKPYDAEALSAAVAKALASEPEATE